VKKIRILNISFDTEIRSWEIPAFRGAVIAKVGQENLLFHNHVNNTEFRYKYPLIQYKQIHNKPVIVCVDFGVDEIHKFFEKRDWSLDISGRTLDMKIGRLDMNQFTMQVWDRHFAYHIRDWLALNQENYRKYTQLTTDTERMSYLESLLKANILSFAKGIDWTIEKPIELTITKLYEPRMKKLKQQKVLTFDLDFSTNVFIPNHIGLGKSVSLGFGVVSAIRN